MRIKTSYRDQLPEQVCWDWFTREMEYLRRRRLSFSRSAARGEWRRPLQQYTYVILLQCSAPNHNPTICPVWIMDEEMYQGVHTMLYNGA